MFLSSFVVQVWDFASGELRLLSTFGGRNLVQRAPFVSRRRSMRGSFDRSASLLTWKLSHTMPLAGVLPDDSSHKDGVWAVQMDEAMMLTGGADGYMKIWRFVPPELAPPAS